MRSADPIPSALSGDSAPPAPPSSSLIDAHAIEEVARPSDAYATTRQSSLIEDERPWHLTKVSSIDFQEEGLPL